MLIVGVDTETTAKDGDAIEVVELGACLYDTESKRFLNVHNQVLSVQTMGASWVHGISAETATLFSEALDTWSLIRGDLASCVVAHNAAYDHPLVTKLVPGFLSKPWLCTDIDLDHATWFREHRHPDYEVRRRNPLSTLSLAYWLPVIGQQLHMALFDAMLTCQIAGFHLRTAKDLESALAFKDREVYRFVAYGPYNEVMQQSCKEQGFFYVKKDEEHFPSIAHQRVKDPVTRLEADYWASWVTRVSRGSWLSVAKLLPKKAY